MKEKRKNEPFREKNIQPAVSCPLSRIKLRRSICRDSLSMEVIPVVSIAGADLICTLWLKLSYWGDWLHFRSLQIHTLVLHLDGLMAIFAITHT